MFGGELLGKIKARRGYTLGREDISTLVRIWREHKWPVFAPYFHNNPTIEFPISIVATEDEISKQWWPTFYSRFGIDILKFGYDALIQNRHPSGEKLGKFFRKLVQPDKVADFDYSWNKLRENIVANGFIRITVHPIELLMISEATKNSWTTCHSIHETSSVCYFESNFLYATDTHTILVYFHNGRDVGLCNLPLKIWRQLWYWVPDEKTLISSRQYPSERQALARKIAEIMCSMFGIANPCKWPPSVEIEYPREFPPSFHPYFDTNYWSAYSASVKMELRLDFNTPILDSALVKKILDTMAPSCSICGQFMYDGHNVSPDGTPICPRCYRLYVTRCSHCGAEIWQEDAYEDDNYELYCGTCWENQTRACDICGSRVHWMRLFSARNPRSGQEILFCRVCRRWRIQLARCGCGEIFVVLDGAQDCGCGCGRVLDGTSGDRV